MIKLWFIIYMTFSGWNVVQIDSHPGLTEQCHFNDRNSSFCIVSVETPVKQSTAKRFEY